MNTICTVEPGKTYRFKYNGKLRIGYVEKYVSQDNFTDYVVCKVGGEYRSFTVNLMKEVEECDES